METGDWSSQRKVQMRSDVWKTSETSIVRRFKHSFIETNKNFQTTSDLDRPMIIPWAMNSYYRCQKLAYNIGRIIVNLAQLCK